MDEAAGVQRRQSQDGVEFALPPRVVPPPLPWFLLLVGIAITIFIFFWMGGAGFVWRLSAAGWPTNPGEWMAMLFPLLGLPGLAGGLGFILIGTLLLCYGSRCSVVVGELTLRLRESLGPVHWSWTVQRADLRALSVGGSGLGGAHPQLSRYQAVLVRRAGRKDLALAIGYDPAVLHALCAGLEEELRRSGVAVPVAADPRLGPPPGNLAVEEDGSSIAIAFPRPWRPWPLLIFATAWLGTCAFFGVQLFADHGNGTGPSHGVVAGSMLTVLSVLGIVQFLICIDSGWRRTSLLWDGAALSLIRRSPLRRAVMTWNRDELLDVTVEERGTDSGRYQVLAVVPTRGKQRDLPLRLDPVAVAWVAARLRQLALHRAPAFLEAAAAADAGAGAPAPGQAAVLPEGSAIRIVPNRDGVEITLPARGWFAGSYGLAVVGMLFMVIAIAIGIASVIVGKALDSEPFAVLAALFVAGGALTLIGARIGTRRIRLRLDAVELTIEASDCLGGGKRTLPRAQLDGIRVEDSSIEVNNRKLRRLALVPRAGQALTCATGWPPAELEAVAGALRTALG